MSTLVTRHTPGKSPALRHTALLLLVTLLLPLPGAAASEDPAKLQQQLLELEAEINQFRELLKSTEGERSSLEQTLESNEKDINRILKKIEDIQQDLKQGKAKLSDLSSRQKSLDIQKREQQDQIATQVRAAYMMGDQPYLKVVLNQEDPNKLARMLTYYHYIFEARKRQISDYEETLTQLQAIGQSIENQNLELTANRAQLEQQKSGLVSVQAEKRQTLTALKKEIAATGNMLEKSLADRERLESLIGRITRGINNLPAPADSKAFAEMRGNLLLPVAGTVQNRFGSVRADGKLKWNGVFVEAPEGAPVHSVHYGRVVFSDWLRGFGMLMIISHGEGFMSLYGHNQVLYREAGDWVSAGDLIANVGNTGGQQAYGLYFEIREAGKPSDPQIWCQARNPAKAA